MSFSIRQYPLRLDDNVVRAVASLTFLNAILLLLREDLHFLIYLLFGDFILRYIHPKISPVTQIMKFINLNILDNEPIFKFSPPKRFAVLIGVIMTGLMSIFTFLQLVTPFYLFLGFLIIASGLQSWFDYCLGCTVYDFLVKRKILARGSNLNEFQSHLAKLKNIGEISEEDLTGAINIQDKLMKIALELDGSLSEEEDVMIVQIQEDIRSFVGMLEQALEDGVISKQEKALLMKEGNNVAKNTYDLTSSSARAKTYLIMAQDYIDHLNRKLIKNWQ